MLRDQLGPRLIEEAKANFDAPIYNNPPPDEDKPEVKAPRAEKAWGAGEKRTAEKPAGHRDDRDAPRGERREGGRFGDKPGFGEKPKFGDKPKGRGDGKFAGKGKPSGKFDSRSGGRDDRFEDEKPKKRAPMGTSRTANVWMAPGARPTKDGGAGKSSARAEAERLFNKPTEAPRRPNINRVEGDSDWIRAEEAPAQRRSRDEDGGGFRDRGDRGDRSDRGPRQDRGDRPFRSERPDRGDRPARGERPERGERREGGDRSFSDRPRSKPPFSKDAGGERPAREGGERKFSRPQGERSEGRGRPFGDRPDRGDRPQRSERGDREGGRGGFGGKPGGRASGERSFGERSGGERSFGERSVAKDRASQRARASVASLPENSAANPVARASRAVVPVVPANPVGVRLAVAVPVRARAAAQVAARVLAVRGAKSCALSVVNSVAEVLPRQNQTRSGRPSTGRGRACSTSSAMSTRRPSMAPGFLTCLPEPAL